jgi:hypothetical protein
MHDSFLRILFYIFLRFDYLTEDVFKKYFIFGKGSLDAENKDINTLMFPKLLDLYTNNSWLVY